MTKFTFATVTIISLLFSLSGFATEPSAPPTFQGDYSFQGRVTKLATLETQMVYTGIAGGEDRVNTLESKGYECESQGSYWWMCKTLREDISVPQSFADHFRETYRGKLKLHFGQVFLHPELAHSAYDYEEWQINQKVELDGQPLVGFRYVHTGSTQKLLLGDKELVLQNQAGSQTPSFGFVESLSEEKGDAGGFGYSTFTYYVFLELDPQLQ